MEPGRYKNKYRIPSTRLPNWNYSKNAWYFITICTKNRFCFFGDIKNNKIKLSDIGRICDQFWRQIPDHFPFVALDEYVVMPNHIHGILGIWKNNIVSHVETRQCPVETRQCPVETRHCLVSTNIENRINRFQNQGKQTISSIIGSYKSICTKTINKIQNNIFFSWQPRFYDHIIRNEKSLNRIRQYIRENPIKWIEVEKNPKIIDDRK